MRAPPSTTGQTTGGSGCWAGRRPRGGPTPAPTPRSAPSGQGGGAPTMEAFAGPASRSVQHTLYAIADVVLATYQEIADMTLALHERPYRPADPFGAGRENPDDLFG